tara:strand:+ start:3754 stop:7020 length:3267 start_codon:yes stop_codon:yes gene_type:complete
MSNVALKGFTRRIIPNELDIPESSLDGFFKNPKLEQFKRGVLDENSVALSFAATMEKTANFKKDPTYDFLYDEQLKPYVDNIDYFRNSGSKLESKYLINELKEQSEMIATNPGAYFIGRLTGGILDPVTYAAFSMKAFRTASGAYNLKRITAIATAEELYKQTINANREKELAYFVPVGTAIVTGLVNTIGRLKSFEGGEAVGKYNKQQLLLDGREEVVARAKQNNGELLDSRILDPDNRIGPKGVGADATNTGGARSYNDDLYDEAIANTLTGLEKTNATPMFRLLKSPILQVRELATDLLDTKLLQNKNKLNTGFTTKSIESAIARKYIYVEEARQNAKGGYKDYLKRIYQENNLGQDARFKKTEMRFKGIKTISEREFQRRISYRLVSKDIKDPIPEVNKVASYLRENFFTRIGREADAEELFSIYSKVIIAGLKRTRDKMKRENKKTTESNGVTKTLAEIEARLADEEARLININATGPLREDYLPRYWKRDLIRNKKKDFKKDLRIAFNNKGINISVNELDEIVDDIATSTPFNKLPRDAVKPDETFDLSFAFQPSGVSKHLRNRVMILDDAYLMQRGWMEDNINIIAKQYFNSTMPDIEISKVFGDVAMMGLKGPDSGYRPSIPQIAMEWDAYINKMAPKNTRPKLREKLIQKKQDDIRDIEASRDLLRGTYGLTNNPESGFQSGIRTLKNMQNMMFLSGFLSAVPDMARLMMQNGIQKGFGQTFEIFANQSNRQILKMSKKEANMVGEALDLAIAGRANTIGNVDEMIYGLNSVERATGAANSFYFTFINLMNVWNTGMKTASSYIGSTKIIEFAEQATKGTISQKNMAKLLSGSIDKSMAKRIVQQYKKYGLGVGGAEKGDLKYSKVARSDLWDDREAAEAFGNALRKEIRTTIITPDKGDVPLWMNKPLGGLLSQFKKFGMAATQAVMMRGLQERDQNFFIGLMFLVGMGAMVDAVRQRAFDRDYSKKKTGDKIASALDRSGAIGIFSDLNRMLEVMSDNELGIAPALGAGKPYNATNRQKLGLVGPSGSLAYNLYEIMLDTGSGNYDYTTARAIRRSLPLQNIWYLDSLFDKFEKGIR